MIQWYSRLFFDKLMRKMTTNMTLQRKTTNNFTLQINRDISFSFILRAINKCYILTMLLILLLPLLVWSHTEERKKEAWENKHDTYVVWGCMMTHSYMRRVEYSTDIVKDMNIQPKCTVLHFKLINKDWIFQ